MVEYYFLARASPLVEVVHVELTDKRIHVGVLKVSREDYFLELAPRNDFEAEAVFGPGDHSAVFVARAYFKQFLQER